MANRSTDRGPTRRKALRDMAALGGLAAAGGLAGPVVLSTPTAPAPNDQLIVAAAATPGSAGPEFRGFPVSRALSGLNHRDRVSYPVHEGGGGVGLPPVHRPLEAP